MLALRLAAVGLGWSPSVRVPSSCPPREGFACLSDVELNNSCVEENVNEEAGEKECVIVRATVDRKIVWQLHVDLLRAVRALAVADTERWSSISPRFLPLCF